MKVSCGLGITWQMGERNYVKFNFDLHEIDCDGNIEEQINEGKETLLKIWPTLVDMGEEKIEEFIEESVSLKPTLQDQLKLQDEKIEKVREFLRTQFPAEKKEKKKGKK